MREYLEMTDTVEEAATRWLATMTSTELREYIYPWARADMANMRRAEVRRAEIAAVPRECSEHVEAAAVPRVAVGAVASGALPALVPATLPEPVVIPSPEITDDEAQTLDLAKMLGKGVWLPKTGAIVPWERLTDAMHEDRGEWFMKMAGGHVRAAERHFFAARLIREQGVSCLADLLPEARELEA
jgi:hypothetical protein